MRADTKCNREVSGKLGLVHIALGRRTHSALFDFMDNDYLEIFNDSFERCAADPLFLDRFYSNFLSSSSEVTEKFKSTDMGRQKAMLRHSLIHMMSADKKPDGLFKIATVHDKNHANIPPQLYSLWLDSIIDAVKQTDTQFSKDTEKAWRRIMQTGIDYMIEKHNES